jgi:hypothetical protein
MKLEEESGEVDVNYQEYKKRRDEARRSPYPSVIVEVMSTPTPDFTPNTRMKYIREDSSEVTSEDIARLNAIFNMSPAKVATDNEFYDALGEVSYFYLDLDSIDSFLMCTHLIYLSFSFNSKRLLVINK